MADIVSFILDCQSIGKKVPFVVLVKLDTLYLSFLNYPVPDGICVLLVTTLASDAQSEH